MSKMPEAIQISPAYSHYEKEIRCQGVIDPTIGRLKWYEINRSDQPFEQSIRDLARKFVSHQLGSGLIN